MEGLKKFYMRITKNYSIRNLSKNYVYVVVNLFIYTKNDNKLTTC